MSVCCFKVNAPVSKTFAPGKEAGAVCARVFADVKAGLIKPFYVPLILMYHFVRKSGTEPLWAKPFVIQADATPGALFAPTGMFLPLIYPVAQSPGFLHLIKINCRPGQVVVEYVAIQTMIQCYGIIYARPKWQSFLL